MVRKILSVILSICIAICSATMAWAEGSSVLELPCKGFVLMEQDSGKILVQENMDAPMAPASLTKIMTILLLMEALDHNQLSLQDKIVCSPNAKIMGGSEIWLEVGEEMSVHDMLKGLVVASANDCAVAVAEHLAGSEEAFVKQMNARASELGMTGTHYVNAHGLDEEGHLTTPHDVAIVTRELMKHEKITEYSTIWMDTLREGSTELVNTNRLIRFYKGATGLKTGTTDAAGHCLSATATRGELSLVAVTMGSPTGAVRFDAATRLLDHGFATYDNLELPPMGDLLSPVPVVGGTSPFVTPRSTAPTHMLTRKKNKSALEYDIHLSPSLHAPVEKGQTLGSITVKSGEEILGSFPLVAEEMVEKQTPWGTMSLLWREFSNMH